jgi:hypothetical protein
VGETTAVDGHDRTFEHRPRVWHLDGNAHASGPGPASSRVPAPVGVLTGRHSPGMISAAAVLHNDVRPSGETSSRVGRTRRAQWTMHSGNGGSSSTGGTVSNGCSAAAACNESQRRACEHAGTRRDRDPTTAVVCHVVVFTARKQLLLRKSQGSKGNSCLCCAIAVIHLFRFCWMLQRSRRSMRTSRSGPEGLPEGVIETRC